MSSTDFVLKLVKSVHQPVHIREYAGKTVAVDGRALFQHVSEFSDSLLKNKKDNGQKEKDNNGENNNNDDDDNDEYATCLYVYFLFCNHGNWHSLSFFFLFLQLTKFFVSSIFKRPTKQLTLLDILRSNDVTPLVVVEGKPLPCDQKKKTNGLVYYTNIEYIYT